MVIAQRHYELKVAPAQAILRTNMAIRLPRTRYARQPAAPLRQSIIVECSQLFVGKRWFSADRMRPISVWVQ